MSEPATFKASIYRDVRFDSDGGGRVTLQFDAMQEVAVIRLLTMRNRILEVTIRVVEGYERNRPDGGDAALPPGGKEQL